MPDGNFLLIAALVVVLAAEFVNGWTDAPNAIATVVSTRVLPDICSVGSTTIAAIGEVHKSP